MPLGAGGCEQFCHRGGKVKQGRNNKLAGRRIETPGIGLGRFAGCCLGSGEGLRRVQRSVNGVLTGTWRAVSRAVGAVFDKGVVCYG